jgi:hypothetical protein
VGQGPRLSALTDSRSRGAIQIDAGLLWLHLGVRCEHRERLDRVLECVGLEDALVQAAGVVTEGGTITLSFQGMQLESTPGHRLGVYVAEPGTPDHDAMILLDMTAPSRIEKPAAHQQH